MDKNVAAALTREREAETAEELIGVLTAISVVSKRMARKLALLEQRSARKEGVEKDERCEAVSTHAD